MGQPCCNACTEMRSGSLMHCGEEKGTSLGRSTGALSTGIDSPTMSPTLERGLGSFPSTPSPFAKTGLTDTVTVLDMAVALLKGISEADGGSKCSLRALG